MTKSEIESNLLMLCQKINEVNPDILLLQEVDVESKRTAYVDELQYVLDHSELNYAVYAAERKSDYQPKDGTGRINLGNAILAKWPLTHGWRIALPMSSVNSSLQNYFRAHRNILGVTLPIPGHASLQIVNIHTDPSGGDGTKRRQIDKLKLTLDELVASGNLFVAGGDFNELPPGSPQWSGFPDIPPLIGASADYNGEQTWMSDIYGAFKPAIDSAQFKNNPVRYFTVTEDESGFWCRTLDHLFTNTAFHSTMVLQDSLLPNGHYGLRTMPLSDHAPLYSVMELKP